MSGQIELRIKNLRELMKESGIDMFVIQNSVSSYYFTLFNCSNSCILITAKETVFLTDFRYITSAVKLRPIYDVFQITQSAYTEIGDWLKKLNANVIAFEDSMSHANFLGLKKAAGRKKLVAGADLLRRLRMVKDDAEIKVLAANQKLNQQICDRAIRNVQNGQTELNVQSFIRSQFLENNTDEAFETIVATKGNSALPHARPTGKKVSRDAYLLIDMGLKKNSYCSDLTRTVWVSQAKGKSEARGKEIYEVVLEAQLSALKCIKDGVAAKDVDAAARKVIADAGYGDYFGHGLGHGVGIEIHEGPTLNPRSSDVLKEGMVVTVEPGIYLPDFGGVRIEDLVVVTKTGFKNLTSLDKKWREISI